MLAHHFYSDDDRHLGNVITCQKLLYGYNHKFQRFPMLDSKVSHIVEIAICEGEVCGVRGGGGGALPGEKFDGDNFGKEKFRHLQKC